MSRKERTTDTVAILHRRYIGDDPGRKAELEQERLHARVARQIYDLRIQAGLSQRELAEKIGTTQSAVSRLENADYEGHSLAMLRRVAEALDGEVNVALGQRKGAIEPVVFRTVLQFLRRSKRLTLDQLAQKIDVPREELAAIEQREGFRPTPRTIHKLGRFYRLAPAKLAALAGLVTQPIDEVREPAVRFAAMSEGFSDLTREEKRALKELVRALKEGSVR